MFLLDTHMHFDLYKDRNAIIYYVETHTSYTIGMTNLPALFMRYEPLVRSKKYFRLALGLHPELAVKYHDQIEQFTKCVHMTRYIGEVGLDYTTSDMNNRTIQANVFSAIVRCCTEKHILSVHSRRATTDVLDILRDFQGKVILHWYSGNDRDLERALDRGYFFSVNHQMIQSKHGQHVISKLPLDRLLIESDAPFTTGMRSNYSCDFIHTIYDYLMASHNLCESRIDELLRENFKRILIT